ncbi:MAG: 50S ribosomal protein L10 [Phycisphaerales bacterium]
MSKTVKKMIMTDYAARLGSASDAMLISVRGLKGTDTTKLRSGLRKKQIKVQVVRNSLVKASFKGTGLENLTELLTGSSALAFGPSVVEVAREIVALLKDFPKLELKGAVLDGNLFKGEAGCKELSKFPTKGEAQAQVVTLIVSPARKLMAAVKGPGSNIAGIIKAIEMKLEKGETIAKTA